MHAKEIDAPPRGDEGAMTPPPAMQHYNELLSLAERQVELADAGEFAALEESSRRFEELSRELPARPPVAATALLKRAAQLGQRTEARLQAMQRALMQDVAVAAQASRAAHGYALSSSRSRRIDHCA